MKLDPAQRGLRGGAVWYPLDSEQMFTIIDLWSLKKSRRKLFLLAAVFLE